MNSTIDQSESIIPEIRVIKYYQLLQIQVDLKLKKER